MLNQLVLVGRLVREPELRETEKGKVVTNITLAVPRSFKSHTGEYETDYLDCTLWENAAQNTSQYCKKGNIIGVKGRIQSYLTEVDGHKYNQLQIIAEKVTFLSPKEDK